MVNVLVEEGVAVILGVIEPDDLVDVEVLENVYVAGSGVTVAVHRVPLVDWAHKRQELAWNDPVEVTVLHLLVVLVFARIKRLEVVPSKVDCGLEALQTVKDCALVVAVTTAGVSERLQVWLVTLELTESLMSVHLEDDDHEGAHKVG